MIVLHARRTTGREHDMRRVCDQFHHRQIIDVRSKSGDIAYARAREVMKIFIRIGPEWERSDCNEMKLKTRIATGLSYANRKNIPEGSE